MDNLSTYIFRWSLPCNPVLMIDELLAAKLFCVLIIMAKLMP